MAVGKVTQDSVNALKPGPTDFFLWDDTLAGFGIKTTPKGAKIYILQFRLGGRGHKTRRYTIGAEGSPWRAASARKRASDLLILVNQGQDIVTQEREKRRVAVDLAFDSYLEDFAERSLKPKWPKSWKPTKRRLELHAGAHLKNKPLPDITAEDIRGLLRKLDKQPAARRNLFAALSFLFNQSVRDGVIAVSPLRLIEPPSPVNDRSRTLGDDELRWLWEALQGESAPYRGVVEDLLFTGQRRNEVAALPWSELNLELGEWHLSAKRAKNGCENIVPLTENMVARFDAIAGGAKWPKSGLVRQSREGTVLSGWSKLKRRLDASMAKAAKVAKAEIEPWRFHDLRRTVATRLQRFGVAHETVEHLLNHREKSRTGIGQIYQTHGFGPEKRRALERWETELARVLDGGSGVVVPFGRRSA